MYFYLFLPIVVLHSIVLYSLFSLFYATLAGFYTKVNPEYLTVNTRSFHQSIYGFINKAEPTANCLFIQLLIHL